MLIAKCVERQCRVRSRCKKLIRTKYKTRKYLQYNGRAPGWKILCICLAKQLATICGNNCQPGWGVGARAGVGVEVEVSVAVKVTMLRQAWRCGSRGAIAIYVSMNYLLNWLPAHMCATTIDERFGRPIKRQPQLWHGRDFIHESKPVAIVGIFN